MFNLASALVQRGVAATVVSLAQSESDTVEGNIRVIRIRGRLSVGSVLSFPPLGTASRIVRLLGDGDVSAVSTHTRFFPMSSVGVHVAKSLNVPLIHTEHGADFVRGQSPFVSLAARLVDYSLGRRVLKKSTAVLAVSEAVQRFVKRLAGVDAQLFYSAVNADEWRPTAFDDLPQQGHVVFVGRIVPGKGWERFLDVAASVLSQLGENAPHFDAFGEGPQLNDLRSEIQSRGLSAIVTAHGQASPCVLKGVLQGGVLVNPSTLAEGFQLTLVEAAAAGARIVSYPVPGLQALIASGVAVTTVDVDNPTALASAVLESLRQPARTMNDDTAREWSWAKRAETYSGVMDGLAGRVFAQRAEAGRS